MRDTDRMEYGKRKEEGIEAMKKKRREDLDSESSGRKYPNKQMKVLLILMAGFEMITRQRKKRLKSVSED